MENESPAPRRKNRRKKMNYAMVAKKGGTTGGLGALGVLVEYIAGKYLGWDAPGGILTGGIVAGLTMLGNWWKHR